MHQGADVSEYGRLRVEDARQLTPYTLKQTNTHAHTHTHTQTHTHTHTHTDRVSNSIGQVQERIGCVPPWGSLGHGVLVPVNLVAPLQVLSQQHPRHHSPARAAHDVATTPVILITAIIMAKDH